MFDYGSEAPPLEFVPPPSLLSCVRFGGGQVKLFNFRAKLSDLWRYGDAMPQHRPKQHVVCLHHFDRPIKFERSLDGCTRRETTTKGDIAFLPAGAPTMLRPAMKDPHRFLFYSYLVFEPSYLAELALSNGIGRPLDFVPTFATPDPFLHEQGREEWVHCTPGDTLIAPANALHAFHNRTDQPARFLSSSGYYHEITLETYGKTVDVNAPLPAEKEPTEAEAEQYLQMLGDAMRLQMYFPQANAAGGLELLRELEKRNQKGAD